MVDCSDSAPKDPELSREGSPFRFIRDYAELFRFLIDVGRSIQRSVLSDRILF